MAYYGQKKGPGGVGGMGADVGGGDQVPMSSMSLCSNP